MTRTTAAAATLFCAALLLAGCKDTHESLLKGSLEQLTDMNAVLKTVNDEASTKAAIPKVKAIGVEIKVIRARAKALPPATPSKDQRLRDDYQKRLADARAEIEREITRIAQTPNAATPELMTILKEANRVKTQ
jgi:hypothetical protein